MPYAAVETEIIGCRCAGLMVALIGCGILLYGDKRAVDQCLRAVETVLHTAIHYDVASLFLIYLAVRTGVGYYRFLSFLSYRGTGLDILMPCSITSIVV